MATTTEIGNRAEEIVANFLTTKGCSLLERNWRTRYCEIDIIAMRDQTIYFCEVKYRSTTKYGSGLEYITARKLQRMTFAAELWIHVSRWQGNYELCGFEVSGPNYTITAIARNVS